jgi:hypothetical protein
MLNSVTLLQEELDVLCFQTEVAGVMGQVPALAIIKSGRPTPHLPLLRMRGAFNALSRGLHRRKRVFD